MKLIRTTFGIKQLCWSQENGFERIFLFTNYLNLQNSQGRLKNLVANSLLKAGLYIPFLMLSPKVNVCILALTRLALSLKAD